MTRNGHVTTNDAPGTLRGGMSAAEAGRLGAASRERKAMSKIGETRQALVLAAPEAAKTLVELLSDHDHRVRFQAAKYVLDRTLGEPSQRVEHISLDKLDVEFERLILEAAAEMNGNGA